jgi:hypothetical protein
MCSPQMNLPVDLSSTQSQLKLASCQTCLCKTSGPQADASSAATLGGGGVNPPPGANFEGRGGLYLSVFCWSCQHKNNKEEICRCTFASAVPVYALSLLSSWAVCKGSHPLSMIYVLFLSLCNCITYLCCFYIAVIWHHRVMLATYMCIGAWTRSSSYIFVNH